MGIVNTLHRYVRVCLQCLACVIHRWAHAVDVMMCDSGEFGEEGEHNTIKQPRVVG